MQQAPISPLEETKGFKYFPRMLNKIRLFAAGKLRSDFHGHIGKGLDQRCCDFLRIDYEAIKEQALQELDDEKVLEWALTNGREINDGDKLLWNHFLVKLGWNDHVTDNVKSRKQESGLENREDIITMVQYMDVDEGRSE